MKRNLKVICLLFISIHISNAQSPEFEWVKQLTGNSTVYAMTLDASANIYVSGSFRDSVDFDPGDGEYILFSATSILYISKLDASGNFIWAEELDGTGGISCNGIVTDESGNVYISGNFNGTYDFDPGSGTEWMTPVGWYDAFVLKLNTSGEFLWAKQMGGNAYDQSRSIALDAENNVYTTGFFRDTADFDPGVGKYELISAGDNDSYISKLDASGNFVWAKQLSSTNSLSAWSVALDKQSNVLTTGYYSYPGDFDPGTNVYRMDPSYPGYDDCFISGLSSAGEFSWAEHVGQYGYTKGEKIYIDASGNIYILGHFNNTADFDPGSGFYILGTMPSNEDGFILKLDETGNFIWARAFTLGELNDISLVSVAVDTRSNVYTAGSFGGIIDVDPGFSTNLLNSGSYQDFFVSQMDSSGNFLWAAHIGGPGTDGIASLVLDEQDNLFIAGYFYDSVDFDPGTETSLQKVKGGPVNAYIAKWAIPYITGIDVAERVEMKVYPNPTDGNLNIDLGKSYNNVKIEVIDMMGQVVMLDNPGEVQVYSFRLPERKGIYIVSVQLDTGEKTMTRVVRY